MIYLYRSIYFLLKNIVLIAKPLLSEHIINWIQLRQKISNKKLTLKDSVWFHASSGEIEYCKATIRNLKLNHPNLQIVLTYSSPSAEKLFNNIAEHVNEFIALPWDEPKSINELIDYINPQCLIFSRTDFWPELIYQAHIRNIALGVISLNPKFDTTSRFVYRLLLKSFKFVSCVDETGAAKLRNILPTIDVSADGDTRFDQVFHRLTQPTKLNLKMGSSLAVFGSTWPEDEEVIFKSFTYLKKKNYKIVICPHDVSATTIERVANKLNQLELKFIKLSDQPNSDFELDSDVLIIDKIGYLADCYRNAQFAFVGGSFKDKVHSVMEPLCCGVPVIVGPFFSNSPEALKYLNLFVFKIETSEHFISLIEKVKNADHSLILNELKKNLNASQKVGLLIEGMLLKN